VARFCVNPFAQQFRENLLPPRFVLTSSGSAESLRVPGWLNQVLFDGRPALPARQTAGPNALSAPRGHRHITLYGNMLRRFRYDRITLPIGQRPAIIGHNPTRYNDL